MLAFEPPDWRGLIGGGGEPTLGGVLACNLAGPRRVRAGSARDYFLGFSAINGWGDVWKAGRTGETISLRMLSSGSRRPCRAAPDPGAAAKRAALPAVDKASVAPLQRLQGVKRGRTVGRTKDGDHAVSARG